MQCCYLLEFLCVNCTLTKVLNIFLIKFAILFTQTKTGTTEQKRTTVPLNYNMGKDVEGLDVIDFPGVDDRDESIPELAELLLSLTRIIIFVIDYR